MKCLWCNKPCENDIPIKDDEETYACCSVECKIKAEKFLKYAKKTGPIFLILTIACIVTILIGSVSNHKIVYYSMAAMGVIVLIFPFCTPQTTQVVGLKKSILIGRCLGILVIALGIFFYFYR